MPRVGPSLPTVLYLTHRVPYPPDKGDRIRTYHLLRQMAKRGRVWLGCLADEPVPPETLAALTGLCERFALVPVTTGTLLGAVLLWDVLVRSQFGMTLSLLEEMWSRNFANLFVSPLRPAAYFLGIVMAVNARLPL